MGSAAGGIAEVAAGFPPPCLEQVKAPPVLLAAQPIGQPRHDFRCMLVGCGARVAVGTTWSSFTCVGFISGSGAYGSGASSI